MVKQSEHLVHPWSNQSVNDWLAIVASIFLLLAAMFALRPYNGIRHDSILYFGQAYRLLFPAGFSSDLFFAYGSQSDFTVFPQILAFFLGFLNVGVASMLGVAISFLLFIAASVNFATKISDSKKIVFWILFCLVIWPSGYGGFGMVKYQEPFLTGRSLAEPIVIFALAALVTKRQWVALTLLVVAASLHPLQALPGLLIWWMFLVLNNRRWIVLPFVLLFGLCITQWLGKDVFGRIFLRYDIDWMDAISNANKLVFMAQWPLSSWLWLGVDLFAVLVATPYLKGNFRRLGVILLTSTMACCVASLLLVDVFRFSFPTGLQLWRIQWILHWFAVVCIPIVFFGLRKEGDSNRPRLFLFVVTMIVAAPYGNLASIYMVLFTVPLFLFWPFISKRIGVGYIKLLYAGLIVAVLLNFVRYVGYLLVGAKLDFSAIEWINGLLALSHPVILIAIFALGRCAWKRSNYWKPWLVALSIGSLVVSIMLWDQRSARSHMIESKSAIATELKSIIEPEAAVFWYGDLLATWIMLERSSYWSDMQEAGLLFNRGTAIESARRRLLLEPYLFQAEFCQMMDGMNRRQNSCEIDLESIRDVCEDEKFKQGYLVLPNKLAVQPVAKWSGMKDGDIPYEGQEGNNLLYLYSCKDVLLDK